MSSSEVRKRVVIEGDASNFQQMSEQVSESINQLYKETNRAAKEYSDNMKDRAIFIDRSLNHEKKLVEEVYRENKRLLDLKKEEELEKTKSQVMRGQIEERYDKMKRQNEAERYVGMNEVLEAKEMSYVEYGGTVGKQRSFYEDEQKQDPANLIQSQKRNIRVGYLAASRMGSSLTAGLGIGMGLGLAGILYTMTKESVELERSLLSLKSTIGETGEISGESAAQIGKSSAEMAELTKNVARSSGGELGIGTSSSAFHIAEISRAFGIDESLLVGSMSSGRMGGTDMDTAMLQLVREMLKQGTITDKNTAKLTEKFEFWARLNNMQSQQMINVMPGLSTVLLGSMEGTGLGVLSDQRQMEFLEKMNQAIMSPDNDYKKAFMMDALGNGNFVDTKVRMEQGIFGKGNLKNVFEKLEETYGGNKDELTLALSSGLNLSMTKAKYLANNLFGDENKSKKEKLFSSLDRLNSINESYREIDESDLTDEEKLKKKKELDGQYKIERKFLASNGIDPGRRAMDMTGIADFTQKGIKNLMAASGTGMLKELSGIIKDDNFQESASIMAQGIGLLAAKTLSVAAVVIKESAELFVKAAEGFNLLFGDETEEERGARNTLKYWKEDKKLYENLSKKEKEEMREQGIAFKNRIVHERDFGGNDGEDFLKIKKEITQYYSEKNKESLGLIKKDFTFHNDGESAERSIYKILKENTEELRRNNELKKESNNKINNETLDLSTANSGELN